MSWEIETMKRQRDHAWSELQATQAALHNARVALTKAGCVRGSVVAVAFLWGMVAGGVFVALAMGWKG